MVTESSNTVYACAACGQPAVLTGDTWAHYSRTSRCTVLHVVEVRIPLPRRVTA